MGWEAQEMFFAALCSWRLNILLCWFWMGFHACMWFFLGLQMYIAFHSSITQITSWTTCYWFPKEIEPGEQRGRALPAHFCTVPPGIPAGNCPHSHSVSWKIFQKRRTQLCLSAFISRWQTCLENKEGFLENKGRAVNGFQWDKTTLGSRNFMGNPHWEFLLLWTNSGTNSDFSTRLLRTSSLLLSSSK